MKTYTDFLSNLRSSGHYALGAGVHNAITAGLAERADFDALWLSSLEVSTSRLLPDVNIITLTEVASILREIYLATNLPIIVDADNGYGSDETARRAAQEFAFAGATAICFEDNAFPKRGSFYEDVERRLEDTTTFCRRIEKVRQAVEGRAEIIARTEGLIAGLSVSETIKRIRAYVRAGANAIFIQTNKARAGDFWTVLSEVRTLAPIVITPTTLPDTSASDFHAQGVDVIIYSNVVMRTIVRAVSQTLTDLRDKPFLSSVSDQIAPLEDLFELTRVNDWIDKSEPGEGVLHVR